MSSQNYANKTLLALVTTLKKHTDFLNQKNSIYALHQMRTTTRRLRNALWLFDELLGRDFSSSLDKKIRKLAKVSSEARDLDVHIQFLKEIYLKMKDSSERRVIRLMILKMQAQRKLLQPILIKVIGKLIKKRFFIKIQKKLKEVSVEDIVKNKIYALAAYKIEQRLDEMLALKRFVYQKNNVEGLHRLRIKAKHVRYSLECFKGLYGGQLNPFYDAVLTVHRTLGDVHNYDVWRKHLPEIVKSDVKNKDFDRVLRDFDARYQMLRQKSYALFLASWNKSQKEGTWQKLKVFLKDKIKESK